MCYHHTQLSESHVCCALRLCIARTSRLLACCFTQRLGIVSHSCKLLNACLLMPVTTGPMYWPLRMCTTYSMCVCIGATGISTPPSSCLTAMPSRDCLLGVAYSRLVAVTELTDLHGSHVRHGAMKPFWMPDIPIPVLVPAVPVAARFVNRQTHKPVI
jgi:hypothetical protein